MSCKIFSWNTSRIFGFVVPNHHLWSSARVKLVASIMESSSWRAVGNHLLLLLCLVLCGSSPSAALGRTRMIQKIHKGVGESWLSRKLEPYECNSLLNPGRNPVKVETYISPAIVFKPGDAKNKYFHIQAPKGHLGLRNFVAEIVDSHGVSVPLHEVYLHHWFLFEYAVPKNQSVEHTQTLLRSLTAKEGKKNNLGSHLIGHGLMKRRKTHELADIGDDQIFKLLNTFGKGAETRRTETRLPAPFALELAPPSQIPMGYESVWILNVHGLDTRGAVDRMGCTECRLVSIHCSLPGLVRCDVEKELLLQNSSIPAHLQTSICEILKHRY